MAEYREALDRAHAEVDDPANGVGVALYYLAVRTRRRTLCPIRALAGRASDSGAGQGVFADGL